MSRPESKNVFYFPHYTKSNSELDLIEHRHGSEGYRAYFRLLEQVANADYHELSLKTDDDIDMFDIGMKCKKEVVDDVIRILANKGKIDKEFLENEKIIWMQDFVETLKPVYVNRRKKMPQKGVVSTCKNTEKRKVKKRKENKTKEKKREEGLDSLLSVEQYEEMFPAKNVKESLNKYITYTDNPTDKGARTWLDREKSGVSQNFRNGPRGGKIAYCSNCGNKEFPNDDRQLNSGSTCCKAEYVPDFKKKDDKQPDVQPDMYQGVGNEQKRAS